MFLRRTEGLGVDNDLVLVTHDGYAVIPQTTPWEAFMVALSLSVMLLFMGLPVLPGLSSFSFSHVGIFLTFEGAP